MSKIFSFIKKYNEPILNIIIATLCIIIIYDSLFVEIRYWRAAIFSLLLISNIINLIKFWKNSQRSDN